HPEAVAWHAFLARHDQLEHARLERQVLRLDHQPHAGDGLFHGRRQEVVDRAALGMAGSSLSGWVVDRMKIASWWSSMSLSSVSCVLGPARCASSMKNTRGMYGWLCDLATLVRRRALSTTSRSFSWVASISK